MAFVQFNQSEKIEDIEEEARCGTFLKMEGDIAAGSSCPTFIMNGIDMNKTFSIYNFSIDMAENDVATVTIKFHLESPCSISIKDFKHEFEQRHHNNSSIMMLNGEKVNYAHIKIDCQNLNIIDCGQKPNPKDKVNSKFEILDFSKDEQNG